MYFHCLNSIYTYLLTMTKSLCSKCEVQASHKFHNSPIIRKWVLWGSSPPFTFWLGGDALNPLSQQGKCWNGSLTTRHKHFFVFSLLLNATLWNIKYGILCGHILKENNHKIKIIICWLVSYLLAYPQQTSILPLCWHGAKSGKWLWICRIKEGWQLTTIKLKTHIIHIILLIRKSFQNQDKLY